MKTNIIGKHAEVTQSTNKCLIGIKGIITDETKNTITINGKKLIKNTININMEGKNITITNKSPSERIKVRT